VQILEGATQPTAGPSLDEHPVKGTHQDLIENVIGIFGHINNERKMNRAHQTLI